MPLLRCAIPAYSRASNGRTIVTTLFEILYISIMYIGPFNHVPEVDFIGTTSAGRPAFFIPLSLLLIACAVFGRARQIRN
jgi:hypothetical protein